MKPLVSYVSRFASRGIPDLAPDPPVPSAFLTRSSLQVAWRAFGWASLCWLVACGSSTSPFSDAGTPKDDAVHPDLPRDDASVGHDAKNDASNEDVSDAGGAGPDIAGGDATDARSDAGSDATSIDVGSERDASDAGATQDGGDGGGSTNHGRFTAMTYNVAGLPAILSSSDPANNTPRIGMLVNGYDIVSVQEDFNYHAALYAADMHPYRTATSGGVPFGSGLNLMSNFAFGEPMRVKWLDCTEADCLTPKGFFLLRLALAPGVFVDVYDLHANAGSTEENMAARRANLVQFGDYVERTSKGSAVIILGDTNTRYTRGASDQIADFVDRLALRDVWVDLSRGGVRPVPPDALMDCDGHPAAGSCEIVDKIFYRSNAQITMTPTAIDVPDAIFRTDAGAMLSDHRPLFATFDWTASPDMVLSDAFGGEGGDAFQDHPALTPPVRVLRLAMQSGARVDRVELSLTNGAVYEHGGTGGTQTTLTLDLISEALIGARLCRGEKDGSIRVVYASFQTDTGRTLSGGTESTDCVTLSAPPGFQISGFHGRAGNELDKLGFVYTRR